jgi:hypothetical protein
MSRLSLDPRRPYQELRGWPWDGELLEIVGAGLESLQDVATPRFESAYEPDPGAAFAVSEDALRSLLDAGREVRGLGSEREISNAIPFSINGVEDTIDSRGVARLQRSLNAQLSKRIGSIFPADQDPVIAPTACFWYPRGSYMGWHTNSGFPGWRMYVSFSEQPGRSFFRYRNPDSGEIVTSPDDEWTVRLFLVSRDRVLWHSIYSETNRFSLGYMVHPWSAKRAAIRLARRAQAVLDGLRVGPPMPGRDD